jgi:hypothetical protein
MSEPLQILPGSWDVEIKWAEKTTAEQMAEAKEFIEATNAEVNSEENKAQIPACILSITFRKNI